MKAPIIDGGGNPTGNGGTLITDTNLLKSLLQQGQDLLAGGMKIDDLLSSRPDIAKAMSQEYGLALSLIQSDASGSLLSIFSKALREGLTADAFTKEFQNSTWWTSRSSSKRNYDLALNTPSMQKDLEVKIQRVADEIKAQAMQVNGVTVDDADALERARFIVQNYWETTDWSQYLPTYIKQTFVDSGDVFKFGGEALQTFDSMRQYANKMGVFMSDSSVGTYVDKIFAGETTVADAEKIIRDNAASYYTQFADRINAGETVTDIVSPYRQMIASMLDLPDPNAVDFINNDGTPAEALMQKALFGGQNGKAMSLYDLQKEIRKDARWLKSSNARSEYTNIAGQLNRMFGGGM